MRAEISAANKERTALEKAKTDALVEKKKLGNKLDNMRKGMQDANERCRKLEREFPWIPTEEPHFGKPGSDYDWHANDPDKVRIYTAAA
jgi:hypothetical protein